MTRRATLFVSIVALSIALFGCNKDGGESTESEGSAETSAPSGQAQPETTGPEQAQEEPFEGVRDGMYVSDRFNVQFVLPEGWTPVPADDSIQIAGPDSIQMIVANSQSIQLVDTNFNQLNDRVSFDRVNVLPDRSDATPLNGLPGYRVEGDALLRGDDVAIYFISQALNVPGEPIMATIFIPGDYYFEHSEEMKAVLDSLEAVDLTPR
jgi:hypothetical protein